MLRITAGRLKGRTIKTPGGMKTRPTLSRLREAIFNSLQGQIEGARVLDLFSGSGAVGYEALSRGAEAIVFVDSSSAAVKCLEANRQQLKSVDCVSIFHRAVERLGTALVASGPFDLVFADPPYDQTMDLWILENLDWQELLSKEGLVVIESRHRKQLLPDRLPLIVKIREKKYGNSVLTTYRKFTLAEGGS